LAASGALDDEGKEADDDEAEEADGRDEVADVESSGADCASAASGRPANATSVARSRGVGIVWFP
jgi:hypothetical protein